MLFDLVGGLAGGLLGGSVSDRMSDRKARRLQRQGQTPCALRIHEGEHRGLSHKWRRGTAILLPGSIDMDGAVVDVVAYDLSSVRSPTARESWSSISPRMKVVGVESATALLEWAVLEKQFEWAAGVVFQQQSTDGEHDEHD